MWRGTVCLVVIIYLAALLHPSRSSARRDSEEQFFNTLLSPTRYNPNVRPDGGNGTGPLVVRVNIFVRMITSINDKSMDYTVQLTFRQQWLDERLAFPTGAPFKYVTAENSPLTTLWTPDLFFSNEKEAHPHHMLKPNHYFRIFPDGTVLHSNRITLKLGCPMDLRRYPHDQQVCSMRIASYGWNTDNLVVFWKDDDPVQIVRNIQSLEFSLDKFLTAYCNIRTNTGEYSCIKVDFLFSRELNYYLTNIYLPCCILVAVSWIAFWLEPTALFPRLFLGVATLFAMATRVYSMNERMPVVSYSRAIDLWTEVCLTFAFFALLESVLVDYYTRRDKSDRSRRITESGSPRNIGLETTDATNFPMQELISPDDQSDVKDTDKTSRPRKGLRKSFIDYCASVWIGFSKRSDSIDALSRIVYPLLFVLFTLIYCSIYVWPKESSSP